VEFAPPAAVTDSTAPSIGDTAATESLATRTSGRGASPLEVREDGNGQTFTYPVSTRFTVTLDERKYPGHTLVIDPEGIVGRVASVPSVDPPLYAVRFEAARPGRATIRSRGFLITVVVTEASAKPQ